jgi:hypothetical protein
MAVRLSVTTRYPSSVPLRELVKRYMPTRALDGIRRRRALRRYLRSLSYEVYDRYRTYGLEELEGELLARRPDITERLTRDILLRTDVLIQQLDRKVESLRARQGGELRELRQNVEALRSDIEALRAQILDQAPAESPARTPAGE